MIKRFLLMAFCFLSIGYQTVYAGWVDSQSDIQIYRSLNLTLSPSLMGGGGGAAPPVNNLTDLAKVQGLPPAVAALVSNQKTTDPSTGVEYLVNADGSTMVSKSFGLDFGKPVATVPVFKFKGVNPPPGSNAKLEVDFFSGVGGGFTLFGQKTESVLINANGKPNSPTDNIDYSVSLVGFLNAQVDQDNPTAGGGIGIALGFFNNTVMLIPTEDLGNVPDSNRFSIMVSTSVFSPH